MPKEENVCKNCGGTGKDPSTDEECGYCNGQGIDNEGKFEKETEQAAKDGGKRNLMIQALMGLSG